jgi:Protein of unknown function (DUF559)/Transcriptional regulator, AbiEi antitoxin
MTSSTIDSRIARIAARQAGRLSRAQALAVGITDSSLLRRLRAGRWERVHPGVYALSGAPPTWIGDVWAAVLATGPLCSVTHETAIRMHGSEHVAPLPVTLTIPQGGHARIAGTFVHQIDDLRPDDVTSVEGLPVSRVPRAVVEVAATIGPRRLERVLDDLVFDRRTSYAQVAAALARVARPGKPGVRTLAAVLDERSGSIPADSDLERGLYAALVGAGLPEPRCQSALPGRGSVEGVVDAAYADCRLILEADGRRWHTRVAALRRDHERDAEAARAGWQTLRFVHEQIERHPDEVAEVVADVRAVRLPSARAGLVATAARPRSATDRDAVADLPRR